MPDEPTKAIEQRIWRPTEQLRIVQAEGQPTRIEGLVVPYESLSEDLGGFRELVKRGAFTESLRSGRDMRVDVEHDERLLLGRTANQTARFSEDERGVWVSVEVPNTTLGRDTVEEVRSRNRDAMSAAWLYDDIDAEFGRDDAGGVVRTIHRAVLTGATITAFPAYVATAGTLVLRSLTAWQEAEKAGASGQSKGDAEGESETANLRRRLDLADAELESSQWGGSS